uniref:Zinc finger protein 514-like isoform X4 n=1 Tax=Petromyzon marinus TaxID=7757 RepID=A0AAJ7T5Q1_PETMA|nr:zinc finger protein 514-like isoform X4 [Petromyzon marinus]
MACAVACPLPEPSGDFPAWLEAQGVNAEVARAMDSELGIRDYGVLRACVGDGLVRAELLATARDRLPFGFYAVLRQVVKALQGAEPHDAGTPCWDDDAAASTSSPGDVTLGGLMDVLLTLFSSLSRELLLSVQRMRDMDNDKYVMASALSTGALHSDVMEDETHPREENESNWTTAPNDSRSNLTGNLIKSEPPEGADLACPADGEPHTLAPEQWEETQQEESAATSITKNTSQQRKNQTIRNIMMNQKQQQPPLVNEIESHEFQIDAADPVGNPQAESSGVKPHRCEVCKSSLSSPDELEAHLCRHTSKKVHSCKVCGRAFFQATGLNIHLRTHTGKAPYTCGVCGDGFWQSSDLKIHLCKHTGERPYQCEVCGRGFYRAFERKVHMRTHTGEKPYVCQVCGRRFLRSNELKVHTRIHTGEKPHVCIVCGRKFTISSDMKKHLRTHTGDKPYPCSVCGQCFVQRSHVKKHERTKHGLGKS